jgi:fructokinase
MPHTIVGLGEALWDLLPSGKHLGGAPLNFAYIASLLGENALIATRIGNDILGQEIETVLRARNLDLSGIQIDHELPTGTVDVSFKNGHPQYEIREPVAWDALEWSPKWREIASKCDALCFGSLAQRAPKSRGTIENFLENTRPDCLKVFDINLRRPFYSREVIESSLALTTILKTNDEELPEIAAMFSLSCERTEQEMHAVLEKFGLKMVFVTRGERGALAATAEEIVEHPGFSVQVRDTVGAGDAFTAAAIHCVLVEMSLEKTLAFANRWASWVASQAGGMPAITEKLRLEMLETQR